MFQLTKSEFEELRSQSATSKVGRGGTQYLPYAFTEHGVLQIANLVNQRAIASAVQARLSSTVTGLCSDLHTTSVEEEGLVGTSASFSRGEEPINNSNPITRRLAIDFLHVPILSQASLVRLGANKKPDQKLIGFELLGGGRGTGTRSSYNL